MKSIVLKQKNISKKQVQNTVFSSSKIEGINFINAKRNSLLIKKLQKYGRAFSI